MSALIASNEPTPPCEESWREFYEVVFQISGLDLSYYRPDQIRRRILGSMESQGYSNLEDFGRSILLFPAERLRLLDRLAINITEFYRNPESWEMLRRFVLPDLFLRRNNLRCWSAGCSNGSEPYTLAILLSEESLGGHEIVATDIDTGALKAATEGVYGLESLASVPPRMLTKYFEPTDDGGRAVSRTLKQFVRFKIQNLFDPTLESGLDLIVCRNVVIYFTEEAKELLYRRFYQALAPGGYLFLGSSESIIDPNGIGYLNPMPHIYRK